MVTSTHWKAPPRQGAGSGRKRCRGTMLAELAVLLLCAGVLAMLVAGTWAKTQDIKDDLDTARATREAYRALQRFVLTQHRLPCPDLAGTGREGDASGACPPAGRSGGLPYAALGLDPEIYRHSLSIRYGVWRDTSRGDLVRPVDAAGRYPALHGQDALLTTAFEVAASPSNGQMPYVAGPGPTGSASNCEVQAHNPAFVLTATSLQSRQPDRGECFALAPDAGASMAVVARSELLGWLLSTREVQ